MHNEKYEVRKANASAKGRDRPKGRVARTANQSRSTPDT